MFKNNIYFEGENCQDKYLSFPHSAILTEHRKKIDAICPNIRILFPQIYGLCFLEKLPQEHRRALRSEVLVTKNLYLFD